MEGLVASRRAIAPSFVIGELEVGDDSLHRWAKTQTGFSVSEQAEVQNDAASLLAEYYDPNKPTKGINGADPFVIALACAASPQLVVVTAEHPGNIENPK